ncbi:MAG: hypothetical protein ACRD1Z_11285 [Vicinamibacteria bacterium]
MSDAKDLPLPQRLVNGAKLLGKLWSAGKRCAALWNPSCDCEEKNDHCRGKARWVELFGKSDPVRELVLGDFGVIESMRCSELTASGLTAKVEIPDIGILTVGPKGQVPLEELFRGDYDGMKTVAQVLREFPGARVI